MKNEWEFLIKNKRRNEEICSDINNDLLYSIAIGTVDGQRIEIKAAGEILKGYLEAVKHQKGFIIHVVGKYVPSERTVEAIPANKVTFLNWEEGI